MSVNPISTKELEILAPTLFTEEPHSDVSDKYNFKHKLYYNEFESDEFNKIEIGTKIIFIGKSAVKALPTATPPP